MTKQQIFSTVTRHLLTQNKRAVRGQGGACAYRGDDGLSCAIGCLIPDAKYSEDIEGASVDLPDVYRVAGLTKRQVSLAQYLQEVHDNSSPLHWKLRLQEVAYDHRVQMPQEFRGAALAKAEGV